MANTFKSVTKASVGTSTTDVYTVASATTTVVIGLVLSNRTGDQIIVDVILNKSNGALDDVYLVRSLPLPNGSAFEYIAGSKLILEAGDKIQVLSNTATSLDVAISVLEQT